MKECFAFEYEFSLKGSSSANDLPRNTYPASCYLQVFFHQIHSLWSHHITICGEIFTYKTEQQEIWEKKKEKRRISDQVCEGFASHFNKLGQPTHENNGKHSTMTIVLSVEADTAILHELYSNIIPDQTTVFNAEEVYEAVTNLTPRKSSWCRWNIQWEPTINARDGCCLLVPDQAVQCNLGSWVCTISIPHWEDNPNTEEKGQQRRSHKVSWNNCLINSREGVWWYYYS